MAPSPKISFSRIIRENYVFRTHSKKFLIWWKRAALNWCVGWKLCLGARGSLHCLLEEKNRKRTIEVLLLLLYFEPKLPNLSIPAVSQNSGPGIFRSQIRRVSFASEGDVQYGPLLPYFIPIRCLVSTRYTLRRIFLSHFPSEQRMKQPSQGTGFFFGKED